MQTFPHFVSKDQSISEYCCQDNSGGQVECPLCGMQGSVELRIFSFESLFIVEATVLFNSIDVNHKRLLSESAQCSKEEQKEGEGKEGGGEGKREGGL